MKKNIILSATSFVLGGLFVGILLASRLQTKYDNGYNNGFLSGGFKVINFLNENVQNEVSKDSVDVEKFLDFKYVRIAVVEIDKVKTIQIK